MIPALSIRKKINFGLFFALALLGLVALPSCSSTTSVRSNIFNEKAEGVSRADPGYLQYLEKNSMRRKAVDLSAIVSGSIYGWSVSASDQKADELLRDAAVWLHINPQTLMTQGNISPLAQFAGPLLWSGLNQAGISGLYLAPVWGAGELWARGAYTDNEDIVQYDFAPYVSNDDEYNALVKNSQELGRFMGGDIIPAATGIGPDFFLATRNYRDYSGVYCMLEVPKQYWSLLPAQNSPGATVTPNIEDAEFRQVAGLSAEQTAALARVGIIPEFLRQEKLVYMPPSGWAATSEVRGVDGQLRRWV
ncbi:MAG: hypothetical protein LBV76_01535, partial [Deltaproteobacteria bacterium]|nr:hypothetical protein [Deltaproteobacteria bacterium]